MIVLYKLIKITIYNTLSVNDTISTNIIIINFISLGTNALICAQRYKININDISNSMISNCASQNRVVQRQMATL